MSLHLTIVVENSVTRSGLLAEHGLSLWLQLDHQKSVLWDTGQGHALLPNSNALGLSLFSLHAIALSHGHYDHTAGLSSIPPRDHPYPVYAHPEAFLPKFNFKNQTVCECSDPITHRGIPKLPKRFEVIPTKQPTEILPGLWATGEIPRKHPVEDAGGDFFADEKGLFEDPLHDDQALAYKSPDGWIVILGCAHAGVINTLELIHQWDPSVPVHTIIGGMHLLHASEERLAFTIEHLRQFQPTQLLPLHCTGDHARHLLQHAFPRQYQDAHVGDSLTFS